MQMSSSNLGMSVLWLTPNKPADISIGRQRIADHLSGEGIDVTLRRTTAMTVLESLQQARHYDVVIGTTRAGAVAGAIFNHIMGTPLVVDHVDPIRQFYETHPPWLAEPVRRLENLAFRVADHVLYVYAEEASRLDRAAAVTKTELGVEFDRFATPAEEVIQRARSVINASNPQEENKIAIYIGGLEPMYHIQELLAAATKLDDWTLIILGAGSLRSLVKQTAMMREDVIFLGTVPHEDVPGYLHMADVGVSLVDDPHTLKVLEYGAAGLPTVQIRGRAESRFDGLVEFCEATPKEIAIGIKRASKKNHEPLQSFARQFDWSEVAETYTKVLASIK